MGSKNMRIDATVVGNAGGASEGRIRFKKPIHCDCFEVSKAKSASNTCGASTNAVPLLRKVARTAALKSAPWKFEVFASIHTSKKSFMRLLSRPSEIIASNFSAMAVSRL